MSDAIISTIIERRRKGDLCKEIAYDLGISESKVWRFSKQNGVAMRKRNALPGPAPRKRPDLWPDIPAHVRITERGD